ncbi:IS30 family transposase [Streptobacillus canis]|uniref:IS30 family transposase n=1 Tax=Streptobacillus canis TaxID=2678686 RepID=UPI0012E2585A|nr:IS30 family transposase [Streptobacillus canis]
MFLIPLKSIKNIADILAKCTKTIKREIKRGTLEQLDYLNNSILIYSHDTSHNRYQESITKKELPRKIDNNVKLAKDIAKLLKEKHSPYATIEKLRDKYNINFTVQTLYNYINNDLFEFLGFKKEDDTIIYKSKGSKTYRKRVIKSRGLSIDERPGHINNREELGHWEIDSVIGLRIVCLLSSKTNDNVVKEVKKIIKSKKYIIKSITSDNGSEFANIKEITDLGIDWYFAHPYCSNERVSNENNNKMVRRFIPKGVSMDHLTKKDVKHIETFMNNYPRKIFNALTSNQVYECLLNIA